MEYTVPADYDTEPTKIAMFSLQKDHVSMEVWYRYLMRSMQDGQEWDSVRMEGPGVEAFRKKSMSIVYKIEEEMSRLSIVVYGALVTLLCRRSHRHGFNPFATLHLRYHWL